MNKTSGIIWMMAVALAGCTQPPPAASGTAGVPSTAPATAAAPEPVYSPPTPQVPAQAMASLQANSAYWISNRVHGRNGWDTNGVRATFSSMKWSLESNWPITRNTNCWLHGVKGLTAISPFNRQGAYHGPATAVTPRHVVMVTHMRLQPGTVVEFATMDNQIVSRKLVAHSDSKQIPDFSIGLLDADLPPSIGFMRIVPPLWRQIMPEAFQPRRPGSHPSNRSPAEVHPLVGFNHWKQAFVADFAVSGVLLDKSVWFPDWFGRAAGGDSGHPLCLLANDELFLITLFTTPAGGQLYPDRITLINGEMEELSLAHKAPVYRLTVAGELMRFKPQPVESGGGPAN